MRTGLAVVFRVWSRVIRLSEHCIYTIVSNCFIKSHGSGLLAAQATMYIIVPFS